MTPTPSFWAAVRLVEFANLRITRENWRTLWESGLAQRHGLAAVKSDDRRTAIPDLRAFVRRFRPGPERREVRRGGVEYLRRRRERWRKGELWTTFVSAVYEHGDAPNEDELWTGATQLAFRRRQRGKRSRAANTRQVRALLDLLQQAPIREWPGTDERGRRVTYRALQALHAEARRRLEVICSREDVSAVVEALGAYRTPGRRLYASGPRGGPFTKSAVFILGDDMVAETLSEHLDGLFARTASDGLWPKLFQCAYSKCTNFGVLRLRREPPHFCRDPHRVEYKRDQERQDRERKRAEEHERFMERVQELRSRGVPSAWDVACKELGYPPSGPPGIDHYSRSRFGVNHPG